MPYKPSRTTEKKPGSAFCVARPTDRPPAPKSYCAAVGIFGRVLLKLYKAPFPTGKKPGRALCAAKPQKKPLAAESYHGAVGISLAGLACHIRNVHICKLPPSKAEAPAPPG